MIDWSLLWCRYLSAHPVMQDAMHNLVTIAYASPVWFAGEA